MKLDITPEWSEYLGNFESKLPTLTQLKRDDVYPFAVYAVQWVDTWKELAKHQVARIAHRFDVYEPQIAAAKKILDIYIDAADAEATMDPSKAIRATVEAFDAAVSAFTEIPILNIIVNLGLFAWDAISAAIEERRKKPPVAVYDALEYDRESDIVQVNDALDNMVDETDWTNIFSPRFRAERLTRKVIRYSNGNMGTSVSVGGEPIVGAAAILPGQGTLAGAWEWPDFPRPSPQSEGPARPAMRQCAAQSWEMLLRNTPQLYRVHANELADRWAKTYGVVEQAITNPHKWGSLSANDVTALAHIIEPPFTARDIVSSIPDEYRSTIVTAEHGIFHRVYMSGFVRWIVDTQLRANQLNRLGTLTCAYVSRGQSAFRDSELRSLLEERRKQLLVHPARELVRLDDVPDVDYRKALSDSMRDIIGGKLTLARASNLPTDGGVPMFVLQQMASVAPPTIYLERDPASGGGLHPLVVAGGVVGGGWLAWKLLRAFLGR